MSSSEYREQVAGEVRAAVARNKMTATALGEATGISRSSLHRKMQGTRSFTVEELIRVADALGLPPSALMGQPVTV